MARTTNKKKGFILTVTAFMETDPKDFAKQAATYTAMAEIEKTGKLPPGMLDTLPILGVVAKPGSRELPPTAPTKPDPNDANLTPLTTDALPAGATVIEATTALDASIFQTIKLADGSEAFRRISAEQDKAETDAAKKAAAKAGKSGK